MSDKTIKAQQNGHEVRGFIESQGIIINRDGDRVTCDIDDLIGAVLALCAYERSLERERCAGIVDAATAKAYYDLKLRTAGPVLARRIRDEQA